MKSALFFLCCLVGVAAVEKDHPIVKVIGLMKDLKAKSIAEGQAEEVSYGKFTYWCSTSTTQLAKAIAEEKETIDELSDTIEGKTKQKTSLEEGILKLEGQIGKLEASATKAKTARKDASDLYTQVEADLAATIKAVGECITALSEAEGATEGGGAGALTMVQKRVKGLIALVSLKATEKQMKTLVAFSEEPKARPDQLAAGDLEAHTDTYDFKSENVVELLKNLKLKFEDDKLQVTKEETNSLNSYDLAKQARDASIDAAKNSKTDKETELGATNDALTTAKADKENTEDDLKADDGTKSTTEESCATKKSEWQTRSKTRALEIEAMDKAVEILGKTSGVRTEAPGNPTLPTNPVDATFLQLRSSPTKNLNGKMKAVELLRKTAKELKSNALERLTVEVSNHLAGPFDAVNNMVEKMIFRLMDEQKQEDEHKLWCDKEISKTDAMKENKDDKIQNLDAEIQIQKAVVTKLTEDIKDAAAMIEATTTFMKEATEIRNTGKSENKLAIKDAKAAQNAIANAVAVLEAFYKESGMVAKESWEFIQDPVQLPKNPSTWDAGYTGVADPKKPEGVLGMLETISSEFSQMESETRAQEAQDQKEFDEAMQANDIEKARRSKESEMKSAEKARRSEKISSLSSQKSDTNAELEKTEQYLEDLKPACVDGDSSYEDRKAARSKEVKALHDAQGILTDAFKETADVPASKMFLQIKSHF